MIVLFALAVAAQAALPTRQNAAVERRGMATNILFRARGQEPGWTLEIVRGAPGKGNVALLVYDYGKGKVSEVLNAPLVGRNGAHRWTSVSRRMAITLMPKPCEDAMSGQPYPMTATVTWRGKTYSGCAAPAVEAAPSKFENVEWIVEDIGGRGVIDRSRVSLTIRGSQVSGQSGCNRYFGSAQVDGDRVTFGQLGGTRMACAPALMAQESAFLKLLADARRWRIDAGGALVVTAADGRTLRARKA